ncbi:hypothetical protein HDU89_003896 [Geranomyces variabilis]|nr:hypothetical protein HDU89_003896 [Geranomyces variabilis]
MSLADAPADTHHSSSHGKKKTRKKRHSEAAAAANSPITDSHHHHHHHQHRQNIRDPTDAQQHLGPAAQHAKEHKKSKSRGRAAPTSAAAVAVDAAQQQRRRSRHRPPSRDRIGSIDGDWDAGGEAGGREQHEPQAAPVLGVVDDDGRPRRLGSGRRLSGSRASSRGNNNAAGSAAAMIESQESLRSRQHLTSVKVKSPVSDKYVIVPTPNPPLRQSELSIDELHEARSNGFSAVAGVAVSAGAADMTAVFIDDGRGRFHPSRSPATTYYDPDSRTITPSSDLEAGGYQPTFCSHTASSPTTPITTDTLLLAFTHTLQSTLSHTLHIAHGLYAGICLLSLILLPVFNQLDVPTTATTTTTVSSYRFLTWYSSHAGAVSVAFNTLATLAVLHAMDVVVARWRDHNNAFGATTTGAAPATTLGNRQAVGDQGGNDSATDAGAAKQHPHATRAQSQLGRQRRQRHWSVRETGAVLILLCTVISWLGAVLITPQDDKLWDSQQQAGYGPYGDPDWFASFSALTTAQVTSDLARWEALNGVRGVFGVLSGLHVFWPAPLRAAATTTPAGI